MSAEWWRWLWRWRWYSFWWLKHWEMYGEWAHIWANGTKWLVKSLLEWLADWLDGWNGMEEYKQDSTRMTYIWKRSMVTVYFAVSLPHFDHSLYLYCIMNTISHSGTQTLARVEMGVTPFLAIIFNRYCFPSLPSHSSSFHSFSILFIFTEFICSHFIYIFPTLLNHNL